MKSRCVAARSAIFIESMPAPLTRWKSSSLFPGPFGSGGDGYGCGTHTGTRWQLKSATRNSAGVRSFSPGGIGLDWARSQDTIADTRGSS